MFQFESKSVVGDLIIHQAAVYCDTGNENTLSKCRQQQTAGCQVTVIFFLQNIMGCASSDLAETLVVATCPNSALQASGLGNNILLMNALISNVFAIIRIFANFIGNYM